MKKLIYKYVKRNTTSIYPSEINYLKKGDFQIDADLLSKLCSKSEEIDKLQTRLQVVQKNGNWFALNNTMLFLLQQMQKQKKCDKIQVDIVALNKVPSYLQQEMMLGNTEANLTKDSYCPSCLNNTINSIIINNDSSFNNKTSLGSKWFNLNSRRSENDCAHSICLIDCDHNVALDGSSFSSEYSDDQSHRIELDELYNCVVCDLTFSNHKSFIKHKLRKKHFGCSICSENFKTSFKLEQHKEANQHWSDNEN